MTAKGEVTSEIMVWLIVVIAVGMVLVWYIGNLYLYRAPIERAADDVRHITALIDEGCNADYFKGSYNPFTEKGNLTVANGTICINSLGAVSCQKPVCAFNYTTQIDLSGAALIWVEENNSIGSTFNTNNLMKIYAS